MDLIRARVWNCGLDWTGSREGPIAWPKEKMSPAQEDPVPWSYSTTVYLFYVLSY